MVTTERLDELVDWMRARGVMQMDLVGEVSLLLGDDPAQPAVEPPEQDHTLEGAADIEEMLKGPENPYLDPDAYPGGVVPQIEDDDE